MTKRRDPNIRLTAPLGERQMKNCCSEIRQNAFFLGGFWRITLRQVSTPPPLVLFLLAALFLNPLLAEDDATTKQLAFSKDQNGKIRFDTGIVRGRVQSDTLTFGIHEIQECDTELQIGGRFGLFNVYRVFSDGKRYGHAGWDWPGKATVNKDGSVTIHCADADDRPFALTGTYRLSRRDAIDLEIKVVSKEDLHGFEVFLASYFAPAYTQSSAYVATSDQPIFMRAAASLGHWLTFPRDTDAVTLVKDGRWKLPPNPVDWVIQPRLAGPLAIRSPADTGVTALLMSRPKDCFAISMPFEAETHYSTYLSLFGHDVQAGKPATCRARLQFMKSPNHQSIIKAYESYAK